jgi:hypothetical protein
MEYARRSLIVPKKDEKELWIVARWLLDPMPVHRRTSRSQMDSKLVNFGGFLDVDLGQSQGSLI